MPPGEGLSCLVSFGLLTLKRWLELDFPENAIVLIVKVAELVLGWDGINPETPGVAESKLVCICPELEGPGCGCRNLEGPGMAKSPSA